MLLNALTDHKRNIQDVKDFYISKMNSLGDDLVNSYRFGVKNNVDTLEAIKILNLYSVVNIFESEVVNTPLNRDFNNVFLNQLIYTLK